MMLYAFAAVASLALGGSIWALRGLLRVTSLIRDVSERVQGLDVTWSSRIGEVAEAAEAAMWDEARIRELEDFQRDIIVAVDEGITEVKRRESRIRSTVSRARKELEELGFEHAGLEAEAHELRDRNGAGGGGMPPVSEGVASREDLFADSRPSPIPGMNMGEFNALRGG